MYLLFRHHNILPSNYLKLPPGEREVLKAFVLTECSPKTMESIRWRMESERLRREELAPYA